MSSICSSEFAQFCDFVVRLRDAGANDLTPEASVERFRQDQEKLRVWNERNKLSEEQARRGEAKPLDDQAMIKRLRARLAERGIE